MNAKDLASVCDTIMSMPGMDEQVKVNLKIPVDSVDHFDVHDKLAYFLIFD